MKGRVRMTKLVFFDIDGTLVTRNNHIPPSTVQAINQLKGNGVTPVIATGRPPVLLKEIAEKLEIDSYVSMNGQYIVFQGEVIYSNPLDNTLVDEIVTCADENHDGVVLCTENELIVNSFFSLLTRGTMLTLMKSLIGIIPDRIKLSLWDRIIQKNPEREHYENKDVFMVNVNANQQEEQKYAHLFDDLTFTRANKMAMDIINKGVSKATGVEKMMRILEIPIENTYAFGDGLNDLEMLQFVGTGVAMDNGFEELKIAADYVTESVFDDGILKGLQKFNLI